MRDSEDPLRRDNLRSTAWKFLDRHIQKRFGDRLRPPHDAAVFTIDQARVLVEDAFNAGVREAKKASEQGFPL